MRLISNEDTSSQIQSARCFRTMVPNVAVAASLCRGAFRFVAGQHGGTAPWLHASPAVQMHAVLNSLKAVRRRIALVKRCARNLDALQLNCGGRPPKVRNSRLPKSVFRTPPQADDLLTYYHFTDEDAGSGEVWVLEWALQSALVSP
jgi:hypothetical protein